MSEKVEKFGESEPKPRRTTVEKAFAEEHVLYEVLCESLELKNGEVVKKGGTAMDTDIPNLETHVMEKRVRPSK